MHDEIFTGCYIQYSSRDIDGQSGLGMVQNGRARPEWSTAPTPPDWIPVRRVLQGRNLKHGVLHAS